MGTVYRGERLSVGRPVAIKFLNPAVAAQDVFVDQFRNEVRALSRVCHPNCASMIDFGVEGNPYVVMDLFGGVTLRQTLDDDHSRIVPPRALHLARQLLAGLAHVHAQRIVHRDVKPENVLVSNDPGFDDHLRIVDFGLAQLHDGPVLPAEVAIGTPSYMAPEQCRREGIADERSDIYAAGVVLFEMLTGVKPFTAPEIGDILRMKLDSPVPRIREVAPKCGAIRVAGGGGRARDGHGPGQSPSLRGCVRGRARGDARRCGAPRAPAGRRAASAVSATGARRRQAAEPGAAAMGRAAAPAHRCRARPRQVTTSSLARWGDGHVRL